MIDDDSEEAEITAEQQEEYLQSLYKRKTHQSTIFDRLRTQDPESIAQGYEDTTVINKSDLGIWRPNRRRQEC